MDIGIKSVAHLLKASDNLHLFYYYSKNALDSCPRELSGSSCLVYIFQYSNLLIKNIKNKSSPFLKVAKIVIRNDKDNKKIKEAKFCISDFNKNLEIVENSFNNRKLKFTVCEQNEIMFEYFSIKKG
jgi:hypothetical protein